MIWVGIDDTDTLDTPGTNQLARHLAERLSPGLRCRRILRHQLLEDPRVPCTRKNGCASMEFEEVSSTAKAELAARLERLILDWVPEGSDPGLCLADALPPEGEVIDWGLRATRELLTQAEAYEVAERCGVWLKGLAGTRDGVIGALAAIGLMATRNDGRVVYLGAEGADALDRCGDVPIEEVLRRGIDEVLDLDTGEPVLEGTVAVEKKLRPNWRGGRVVLFAHRLPSGAYGAVRVP